MRTKSISAKDPSGNLIVNYSYQRNKEGHVLKKESLNEITSYTYDAAYQLVNVENSKSDNEIFAYDPSGNRTSDKNEDYYIYNEDNELLENTSQNMEYDNSGNLVKKSDSNGTVNYDFNIKNRLVEVEKNSGDTIATYYYDPFGRRLWKEVNGTRTYFFYSEQGLVAEYDESGNQIKSYGYKPGSKWTTDPVFMKKSEYNFYINDHMGTPQKIINQDGNVVWSGKYKGFGKVDIKVEEVVNNLRFAGQYYDEENGFYYNMHRYYNFEFGRYNRPDPIGYEGGINYFLYVRNNPISYNDPYGLLDPLGFDWELAAEVVWDDFASGGARDRLYATFTDSILPVWAGIGEISLGIETGGLGGTGIFAHGLGNISEGFGNFIDIVNPKKNIDYDLNFIKKAYQGVLDDDLGEMTFYLTDSAMGAYGLLRTVEHVSKIGSTITHTKKIPAVYKTNPFISINDAYSIHSACKNGLNK
jgi:RHS repeat-associated protein